MRKRVPLNAVRAFEAAARYQNLVRAADELCVTPTAVSHQVRVLEDFLQIRLFNRQSGRLELTAGAKTCFAKLTDALDRIDFALAEVKKADSRERIVVAASPSVTSLWLLPRLLRFMAAAPMVDVEVTTLGSPSNPENAEADIMICNWNTAGERRIEPLMEEEVIPVCAPSLLGQKSSVGRGALTELPLLHDDKHRPATTAPFPTWDRYFSEFDLPLHNTAKGLRFNQSSHAVEAAMDGLGVLLGRSQLVRSALDEGRLVQVSEAYSVRFQYFVVSSWQMHSKPGVLFREWLQSEAGKPAHLKAVAA